jgi:glutathionyl-hydroquinone reductase
VSPRKYERLHLPKAEWVAAEHGHRRLPAEQPRYSIFYGAASRHARRHIITRAGSAWPFARAPGFLLAGRWN